MVATKRANKSADGGSVQRASNETLDVSCAEKARRLRRCVIPYSQSHRARVQRAIIAYGSSNLGLFRKSAVWSLIVLTVSSQFPCINPRWIRWANWSLEFLFFLCRSSGFWFCRVLLDSRVAEYASCEMG